MPAMSTNPPEPGKKQSGPRQMIVTAGAIVGMVVAIAVMFGSGIGGAIPGALFGAVGAVLGTLVAWPISRLFPE